MLGFSIFGIVLSIFLGFCNNACYDRWWEGRKFWGQLIATQRHLIRDTQILPHSRRELVLRQVIGYRVYPPAARPSALPNRSSELFLEYGQMNAVQIEAFATHINPPQFALEHIQYDLVQSLQRKEIGEMAYTHLSAYITQLGAIQAGCDRIASILLPFAYLVLLHRAIHGFCFMLPFGMKAMLGFWIPVMVAWLVYMFLGLDTLSSQLEEPFG